MIETERQRQAAVSWIQYWKASISRGEQSWLGQEEAQESIMALHQQVDAYDKRERRRNADSPCGDTQPFARGEAVDVLLVDGIAMAEEFENYEARLAEARRAVQCWEAEGGAGGTAQPAEWGPDAVPDGEPALPLGASGDATFARGEATER